MGNTVLEAAPSAATNLKTEGVGLARSASGANALHQAAPPRTGGALRGQLVDALVEQSASATSAEGLYARPALAHAIQQDSALAELKLQLESTARLVFEVYPVPVHVQRDVLGAIASKTQITPNEDGASAITMRFGSKVFGVPMEGERIGVLVGDRRIPMTPEQEKAWGIFVLSHEIGHRVLPALLHPKLGEGCADLIGYGVLQRLKLDSHAAFIAEVLAQNPSSEAHLYLRLKMLTLMDRMRTVSSAGSLQTIDWQRAVDSSADLFREQEKKVGANKLGLLYESFVNNFADNLVTGYAEKTTRQRR